METTQYTEQEKAMRDEVIAKYRAAAEQMRKAREFHKYVERSIALAREEAAK